MSKQHAYIHIHYTYLNLCMYVSVYIMDYIVNFTE